MNETMELLRALVERLDYVHDDPAYRAVWTVAHQHIGAYRGPTYTGALAAARKAVEADAFSATAHPSPVQREPSEGEVEAALDYWCAKLPKATREQPIPEKLREHMRGTLRAAAQVRAGS